MSVYLDYAASAPMRIEALDALSAYAASEYSGANPNSLHTPGRQAALALEGARKDIAALLGERVRPSEVLFTSGGTESDNLAVFGLAEAVRERSSNRNVVVVSAIEHEAVLECAPELRRLGFEVRTVKPNGDGVVSKEALLDVLDERVALVSVMAANNETGIVQPIAELAEAAHGAGALIHTDAVQAFTRIPLDLSVVDAASITAHKVGGPVGVGALYLKGASRIKPRLHGGGQERGIRPGTQNVGGALAFAAAAKASAKAHAEHSAELCERSSKLQSTVCSACGAAEPSSPVAYGAGRLPATVHLLVRNVEAGSILLQLDALGYAISSGSACSASSLEASHVLSAMGISRNQSLGALRISFDERVSERSLDEFAQALISVVSDLAN